MTMTVAELILALAKLDQNAPVVISGSQLGFGVDFEIAQVHLYDNEEYISLMPGGEFAEL
jgi:hypothetical protein